MSAIWGVVLLRSSKTSRGSLTPASRAIAGMWSTVLVDPPSAISTLMAFSKAFRVIIFLGVTPFSTSSTTLRPLSKAILRFSASEARAVAQ